MSESTGPLVVIGGHEDRIGDRVILREVARHLQGRPLLLSTAASRAPEKYVALYRAAFADLGVQVVELNESSAGRSGDAGGVFLSGGKQSRLVETIRGTAVEAAIRDIWEEGGVIAGTSAGAAVMGETMLARGSSDETPTADDVQFGSGLGLLPGVLVDQHFAERGRIGRLAMAIAARPELLGVGIDEDTAVVVERDRLRVIGAGGVYVLDGSEQAAGLRFHLLAAGDTYQLSRNLRESRIP